MMYDGRRLAPVTEITDSRQLDRPSRPRPPYPQSHSFSRSYGTILPTSLIYIILVGQRLLTLET